MQLDHVTVRTRDINGAREFFLAVFGLQDGERAVTASRRPGYWLYADGRPLVHLIGTHCLGLNHAAEAIDHVGFRLEGYVAFRENLERLGVRYSTMGLSDLQEHRLFFRTPGGSLLEAIFSEPVSARANHDFH